MATSRSEEPSSPEAAESRSSTATFGRGASGYSATARSWSAAFPSEEFDIPTGRFKFAALALEDNGEPVDGQPVDRGVDFVLTDSAEELLCTTLDPAVLPLAPLDQGNFVIDDAQP